jgi:hypothetical protein
VVKWLSKAGKLIARLLSRPADFTFAELKSVLAFFGYTQVVAGKTGGSRVAFSNTDGDYIRLHKPHPRNELKAYQIEDIITALKERGLI